MFGEREKLFIDRRDGIQLSRGRAWEYVWRSGLATTLVVGGLAFLEARRRDSLIGPLVSPVTAQGFETKLHLPLVMNRYQAEWQLGEPVPEVVFGNRFIIYNQRSDLRVAVHPFYGRKMVDSLVAKYKQDWQDVEITVVNTREELPPRRDGVSGGIGTWVVVPDGSLKLWFAENAVYDHTNKKATYWLYPGAEVFATLGAQAVTLGSDTNNDALFSERVIAFLSMSTDEYLYPGGRELPPEAQTDIAKFNGVKEDGGLNIALFEWPLPGPILHWQFPP